jgi:hypothetical protein
MIINFIIFGPMDKKLWVFEILREVWVGRTCAGVNEVELTKVPKSKGRRRQEGEGSKEKMSTQIRLAGIRWSLAKGPAAWAGRGL